MTQAPVTTGVGEPLDIHGYFPSPIPLDDKLVINDLSDVGDINLGKVIATGCIRKARLIKDLTGGSFADPMDIGQGYNHVLIFW